MPFLATNLSSLATAFFPDRFISCIERWLGACPYSRRQLLS